MEFLRMLVIDVMLEAEDGRSIFEERWPFLATSSGESIILKNEIYEWKEEKV